MLIDIHPIYQIVTNWESVANKVNQGLWVKAAEGNQPYRKKPADSHIKGAQSVGIPTGVYGWAYGNVSPESQANALISEAERLNATKIRPMFDVEDGAQFNPYSASGRNKIKDYCVRWSAQVRKHGHEPAIYLPAGWAGKCRPDRWGIDDLCIVIARYGTNNGSVSTPPEGGGLYTGRYDVHQYTSVGRISGINGNVDLNRTTTSRYLNNKVKTQEWDEMATKAEIAEVVAAELRDWSSVKNLTSDKDTDVRTLVQYAHKHIVDVKVNVLDDESKLAAAIAEVVEEIRNTADPVEHSSEEIASRVVAKLGEKLASEEAAPQ